MKWMAIRARFLHWYRLLLFWLESRLPSRCKKTRLIYLDQNALIGLGLRIQRDTLLRDRVNRRIGNGSLKIVVSPWHLVETANTANLNSATRLADFIDGMNPGWIHERRELQKLDVQEDFYRFCNVDFTSARRVTSKAAVIGALFGVEALDKYDIPSRNFVRQWI